MKKVFTDGFFLFYTLITYLIYIIFSVFLKKDFSDYTLVVFTLPFIYAFIRIMMLKGWLYKIQFLIFILIPFVISLILVFFKDDSFFQGWEISVSILIPFFLSLLFKSEDSDSIFFSKSIFVKLYTAYGFALIVASIHYFASYNVLESLYLILIAAYPSAFIIIVISFFRFIVEAAVSRFSLNSFNPFKYAFYVKRIFFTSDGIFSNIQQVFGGIILADGITENYFKENAALLDKVLNKSGVSVDNMKRKAGVSSKVAENKELKMAPLKLLIASKCTYDELKMPENLDDGKTYLGLAENNKLLGYYIFDKVGSKSSSSLVKMLKEQFGIDFYIVNSKNKDLNFLTHISSFNEVKLNFSDIVMTDNLIELSLSGSPLTVAWGTSQNIEKADISMMEPTMISITRFVEMVRLSGKKMDKVLFFSYIPFLIPVFAANYKIFLPELSTVSIMLSLLIALFLSLYSGGMKR